jgi:hypothetical protein
MLEPQLSQARFSFIAPCSSDRGQFAINRDRRFPVVCFFEQMRRVETGFIEPEKLVQQVR